MRLKWPFSVVSVTGQRAIGTNYNVGNFMWTWGKTSLQSTGTIWSEKLWILLLWRYSEPSCMLSCVINWREFDLAEGLDLIFWGPSQPLCFFDSLICSHTNLKNNISISKIVWGKHNVGNLWCEKLTSQGGISKKYCLNLKSLKNFASSVTESCKLWLDWFGLIVLSSGTKFHLYL